MYEKMNFLQNNYHNYQNIRKTDEFGCKQKSICSCYVIYLNPTYSSAIALDNMVIPVCLVTYLFVRM